VNLLLLFEDDFIDPSHTRARIGGRRLLHLRKVLRARPGTDLEVGVADGSTGRATVCAIDRDHAELEISLGAEPPPPLDVVLVIALPRPPVLRRTLIAAASLGVKQIELIAAERVEKSFWQSHATEAAAIREQMVLGLEQARDTRLPEVSLHRRFSEFVSGRLPDLCVGRRGYVADPSGPIRRDMPWPTPALLAVGPEGGWVTSELERFAAAGLGSVGLGERILRIETALAILLGRFA
jgi:RsmE family RNA methyltransferase